MKILTIVIATVASLTGLMPAALLAQEYPTRPVRIIVPFSTGTAADIVARHLGAGLEKRWGQPVVVENIAGAGGNIGAGTAARARPDGYTLLMLGSNHVINPSLYAQVPYDLRKDFRPVARVAAGPLAIVVRPDLGVRNLEDLKTAAAPGKPLLYGSGGNGSITHLAVEVLKTKLGIAMTHVPYKSIAPMLTDLMGGQIALGAPAAASVIGFSQSGALRILAVTGAKRTATLPDVPTVQELGVADYDIPTWNGLLAPAGTPDAIVRKLYQLTTEVAQSEAFVSAIRPQAMDADLLGPDEFAAFIDKELNRWARLITDIGAKID